MLLFATQKSSLPKELKRGNPISQCSQASTPGGPALQSSELRDESEENVFSMTRNFVQRCPACAENILLNSEVASARQSVLTLTNESAMPPFIQRKGIEVKKGSHDIID